MDQETELFKLPNGEEVTFYPETHTYIVRGVVVPSITTLLKLVYGDTYAAVNPELLKRSADYGTAVHGELENLIQLRKVGIDISNLCEYQETKNYFNIVEPIYHIEPLETEKVVVFYNDKEEPIAAGRFDLLANVKGNLTLCDFKTTSTIHRQLVTAQLNLYLRGLLQSGYVNDISNISLGVIHLSGEAAKYTPISKLGEGFFKKFIK